MISTTKKRTIKFVFLKLVQVKGLEPICRKALAPKASASANFATPAEMVDLVGLEPTTARL